MAATSRAAWVLVTRAAERADRVAAEAEQAHRESAVAEAERAEERELANNDPLWGHSPSRSSGALP